MKLRELLGIAFAILMGSLFFLFDVSRPLGTATPILYVSVVALGLLALSRRLTLIFAMGGTILTLSGVLFSPYENTDLAMIFANRLMALFAIWTVAIAVYTYLCMQERINAALTKRADTDELTGCLSRRRMLTELEHRITEEQRCLTPLSILVIDIDHFKQVNDSHGHIVGDAVLKNTAGVIAACNRAADLIGRFGGEEFLVICPNTDLAGAQQLGERMCQAVRDSRLSPGDASVIVTISVGVAQYQKEMKTVSDFIAAADKAMYRAKERGRDAVELHVPGTGVTAAVLES